MVPRTAIMVLAFCAFLSLLVLPVSAEEQVQDVVIYQTTFTTNPGWITNSPRTYYWVPEQGIYHYEIEPSSGAYAYIDVDYPNGPFTLEFDLTPLETVDRSAFRLAFSTKEMDRTKGTIALSEFTNGKNGRLMWIRAVTPSNKLYEVSSDSFSYGEKTGAKRVNFVDGRTYHVVLQYDDVRTTLTMRVIDKPTNNEIWGYFLNVNEDLKGMSRIVIGPVGDYSNMGPVAKGYIDNVRLTTVRTVTVTTTGVTTVPTEEPTPLTTVKKTTRPTTPPPPTPTPESPLPAGVALAAAGLAGALVLYGQVRRNR